MLVRIEGEHTGLLSQAVASVITFVALSLSATIYTSPTPSFTHLLTLNSNPLHSTHSLRSHPSHSHSVSLQSHSLSLKFAHLRSNSTTQSHSPQLTVTHSHPYSLTHPRTHSPTHLLSHIQSLSHSLTQNIHSAAVHKVVIPSHVGP